MPRIERYWATVNPVSLALWPLSRLFALVSGIRRFAYRVGLLRSHRFQVPVLIIGNITVGGTGKTPLVIWMARHLQRQGWQPGIVSRGYGGKSRQWPQQVRADSDPATVGDEAVVLAGATGCPMFVGPNRPAAVAALLQHTATNIVIADDGMQHYALARDIEIAVVDGKRRFGNAFLLPAGPLREPTSRLDSVDMVVTNGQGEAGEFSMKLHQPTVRPLRDEGQDTPTDIAAFAGTTVHAVAGIGNPKRFFDLLQRYGVEVQAHPFPDHHAFTDRDLDFTGAAPVMMTEKDAVKCRHLTCRNCWVVNIEAQPDAGFVLHLNNALKEIVDGQKAAGHPGLPDL